MLYAPKFKLKAKEQDRAQTRAQCAEEALKLWELLRDTASG